MLVLLRVSNCASMGDTVLNCGTVSVRLNGLGIGLSVALHWHSILWLLDIGGCRVTVALSCVWMAGCACVSIDVLVAAIVVVLSFGSEGRASYKDETCGEKG